MITLVSFLLALLTFVVWFWAETRSNLDWETFSQRASWLPRIRYTFAIALLLFAIVVLSGCARPTARDANNMDQFVRYVHENR
jgi:hypothetical protein